VITPQRKHHHTAKMESDTGQLKEREDGKEGNTKDNKEEDQSRMRMKGLERETTLHTASGG
jgi:hypothetical protein